MPAGPFKAGDKPVHHGIAAVKETDWVGGGRGFGVMWGAPRGERHDHRHLTADQIGDQGGQISIVRISPTIFDRQIPALDETCLGEAGAERLYDRSTRSRRAAVKISNHRRARWLRLRAARKCRRAPAS